MKKMLGLIIYGGILFGLSAGGAWFMHSKHQEELAKERKSHKPNPDAELVASTTHHPTIVAPNISESQRLETRNKVPIRPEAISAEEIVVHGIKLKERDEAVRLREQALERVEAQYTLMLKDIEGEQREIEGLMEQARAQNKAADEILDRATAKHQEAETLFFGAGTQKKEAQDLLDQVKQEQRDSKIQSTTPLIDESMTSATASPEDRITNLRSISGLMQNMSSEVGASLLGEMMDNGENDLAVQLISRLEDRTAAGILDEMSQQEHGEDKVAELLRQFTELQGTAPVKKKAR